MAFWKASGSTSQCPVPSKEALAEFHAHGIPMALLSNCSFCAQVIPYELSTHRLATHLNFVMVTADYCGRKPHVLLLETAAARFGIRPVEDIWFIGDRLDTDVAGAQAAGMHAVYLQSWPKIVKTFANPCKIGKSEHFCLRRPSSPEP